MSKELDKQKVIDFFSQEDVGIPCPEGLRGVTFNLEQEAKLIRFATIRRSVVKVPLPEKKKEGTYYKYDAKPDAVFDGAGIIDQKSRDFCRIIVRLNKLYTKEKISRISFQLRYSVFSLAGGINCRHQWEKVVEDRSPRETPPKGKVYVNPVPGK